MACIVVFYSCYTSCICQHWNPMPRWAAPAPLPSPPPLHKGRRRAELYFCTHTLTLHGFSSWNLKTQRDGGKSCPLHCIALVYIHTTCTNYDTCLPTPSTWLTSPSTNYGWCKSTNYSTSDGLLPYFLQFQDWAAELTIYLPLTALGRRKWRISRLCLTVSGIYNERSPKRRGVWCFPYCFLPFYNFNRNTPKSIPFSLTYYFSHLSINISRKVRSKYNMKHTILRA
jgi:hypothetical protein